MHNTKHIKATAIPVGANKKGSKVAGGCFKQAATAEAD